MPVRLEFADGEPGEAIAFDGQVLRVVSSRAFAPGMPLEVVVSASPEPFRLRGKSYGSRLGPEGRYEVRIRLVNLRRAERDRLRQLLGE